jgi:hypothetical protein
MLKKVRVIALQRDVPVGRQVNAVKPLGLGYVVFAATGTQQGENKKETQ